MVKTPRFHCRGCRLHTWSANFICSLTWPRIVMIKYKSNQSESIALLGSFQGLIILLSITS